MTAGSMRMPLPASPGRTVKLRNGRATVAMGDGVVDGVLGGVGEALLLGSAEASLEGVAAVTPTDPDERSTVGTIATAPTATAAATYAIVLRRRRPRVTMRRLSASSTAVGSGACCSDAS